MPVPLDKIAATSSTIVVISTTILVVILPILLLLEVAPDENCDVFLFQIFFSIALARAQGRGSV